MNSEKKKLVSQYLKHKNIKYDMFKLIPNDLQTNSKVQDYYSKMKILNRNQDRLNQNTKN